jgi:hypothetical protein
VNRIILTACLMTAAAASAWAQPAAQPKIIFNGVAAGGNAAPAGGMQFDGDQKLMFDAAKKAMGRDFKGAENEYSLILAHNPRNIEAYLQRGLMRRELNDGAGAIGDGRTASSLANNALKNDPNNSLLYYQRGMGFRLARNYPQAIKDINTAMRLGGQAGWKTDLQAIELEQKANP